MDTFDIVEMLQNLQADANQIILSTTLNASEHTTKEQLANDIQKRTNNLFKEYLQYILNK